MIHIHISNSCVTIKGTALLWIPYVKPGRLGVLYGDMVPAVDQATIVT